VRAASTHDDEEDTASLLLLSFCPGGLPNIQGLRHEGALVSLSRPQSWTVSHIPPWSVHPVPCSAGSATALEETARGSEARLRRTHFSLLQASVLNRLFSHFLSIAPQEPKHLSLTLSKWPPPRLLPLLPLLPPPLLPPPPPPKLPPSNGNG